MTGVPAAWDWAPLGDVVDVFDHLRVPVNRAERADRPGPIPYYGATGQVGWIDEALFNEELCLLGEDGAPFFDLAKAKAYVIDGPSWVNNHAHVLRARGCVTTRFLKYALDQVDYRPFVTGTTRAKLTKSAMSRIPLPIPPLAEQRRIVAAIEEHLSRLDAACGSLTRAQRLLERWRLSSLSVLTQDGAPRRRVGDVARVGSGATPKRDRPEYWTGGDVPWVTSGQLTRPFVTEPAALITQKALRETSCRVWPKGTLLVALYGEGKTRGHCSELMIDAATNQACAAIQIHDPDVDPAFLKLYFNATYRANRSLSAGGVQPNLSLGLIKDMTFPCPSVAEQNAIVAGIEVQLAQMSDLGAAVSKALAGSAGLRRSILARAFRGELVSQDPADQPASLLLERITAERGTAPKATGRRRAKASA